MKTKLGLCNCRCDSSPCTGTLCVVLTGPCSGNNNGYAVVVKDHSTGATVATGSTSGGSICFAGLPAGSYDATASKTSCNSLSWSSQTVTCSTTTTLTGTAMCSTNTAVNVTVTGCYSIPLPGAVVTITGPDSGTVTTDAAGKAVWYTTATGSFSFTITHPSGRFATVTGSFSKLTLCTAAGVGRSMSPASGFTCCGFLKNLTPPSPYPIPTTLYITDGVGTATITVAGDTCNSQVCVSRDMDNTSTCGGSLCLPVCSCTGGGTANMPPLDIGTQTTALRWGLTLSDTLVQLQQSHPIQNAGAGGLQYNPAACSAGTCTPQTTHRNWRMVRACPWDNSWTNRSDTQSSYTVNSAYPLNITFNYAAGTGFGPAPIATPVGGEPYTLSATLHE